MAGGRRSIRNGSIQQPVIPTNSLVASAVAYAGDVTPIYRPTQGWQQEAWRQFGICPELQFAANWIANALSRCQLLPGEVDALGNINASDDPTITKALQDLFSGNNGQAQMLHAAGLHLTIAGEFYLVGRFLNPTDTQRIWEVVGTQELSQAGQVWVIKYDENMTPVTLTDRDTVIRVWRPRPEKRIEATSPCLALLPVLTEIEYLTRHIFAQTTSRIAGAGVWALPSSLEFPGSDGMANKAEGLMAKMGEAMSISFRDPGNPASLVPLLITVPDAAVNSIKEPIHFWSEFDAAAVETRSAALSRFCVGMDLPPEVISGMTAHASSSGGTGSGVSHWTSWQIEESAIKLHIEPLLELIGNAVTIGYLRKITNKANSAIKYDTNKLKLQPDRSKEAAEIFDRGELCATSLRFYSGFSEDDAPSVEEHKNFILNRIAGGSAAPDQVAWALGELGLDGAPDGQDQQPVHPGTNQAVAPSLEDHPSRDIPDAASSQAILLRACEPVVMRALERVGGRLRNKGIKPDGVPQHEVYLYAQVNGDATALLEGAWSLVPMVAEGLTDSIILTRVLNAYAENLLTQKVPHSREALANYLTLVAA